MSTQWQLTSWSASRVSLVQPQPLGLPGVVCDIMPLEIRKVFDGSLAYHAHVNPRKVQQQQGVDDVLSQARATARQSSQGGSNLCACHCWRPRLLRPGSGPRRLATAATVAVPLTMLPCQVLIVNSPTQSTAHADLRQLALQCGEGGTCGPPWRCPPAGSACNPSWAFHEGQGSRLRTVSRAQASNHQKATRAASQIRIDPAPSQESL